MQEPTTARRHTQRHRDRGGVFLPPAAGRRLFARRPGVQPLLRPVLVGAITTALLTLAGGFSTPVVVVVGIVAALLVLGLRVLWLRGRS